MLTYATNTVYKSRRMTPTSNNPFNHIGLKKVYDILNDDSDVLKGISRFPKIFDHHQDVEVINSEGNWKSHRSFECNNVVLVIIVRSYDNELEQLNISEDVKSF